LVDTGAERLFGFVAADLIGAVTIVSLSASISAMILAGPRVDFAIARDGLVFGAMVRVHPDFRAPTAAILAQPICGSVLVLAANLPQLASPTGFAIVLFRGLVVNRVFAPRGRHPQAERQFRAWRYPWAPALFLVASAAMVANELWRNPVTSAAGVALIAL